MKELVLAFLVATATAAVIEDPLALYRNYHENIGIPLATKIKAIEESQDFDGGDAPGRIWGGGPSQLGAAPYLGGVLLSMNNGGTSVCGSALLNTRRALTAGHCCLGVFQYEVVLGSTTLFYGGTRVTSKEAKVHDNYDSWLIVNDIAVILFDTVVTLNANIAVVGLPTGALLNNDFNGWWGTVSGFGMVGTTSININQVQSQTDIQIVSNTVCNLIYGNTITSNSLCASSTGRSSCSGDSGGPLTVWNGNTRVLVGIVSFHHREGCTQGHPVGLTRVTSFVPWIQANL